MLFKKQLYHLRSRASFAKNNWLGLPAIQGLELLKQVGDVDTGIIQW